MIFRRHPRWPPKLFALRLLPSHPRLPIFSITLSEPLCFQQLPTIKSSNPLVFKTIRNAPGVWVLPLCFNVQTLQRVIFKRGLSPLECALTSKHRVLPGFGRNCPSVTPLECAVAKARLRNSFRMRSYKKRWGGG